MTMTIHVECSFIHQRGFVLRYRRFIIHCVSKNDIDVAQYNFNAHQLISVIFGRDVAE